MILIEEAVIEAVELINVVKVIIVSGFLIKLTIILLFGDLREVVVGCRLWSKGVYKINKRAIRRLAIRILLEAFQSLPGIGKMTLLSSALGMLPKIGSKFLLIRPLQS